MVDPGMKSGKSWGETLNLLSVPGFEIHRIEIEPGGFCSRHHHRTKFNAFLVEKGHLEVKVWKDHGLVDTTELFDQQSMVVPPGEDHQFLNPDTMGQTVVYEVYWSQMDPNDIVRKSQGGIKRKGK